MGVLFGRVGQRLWDCSGWESSGLGIAGNDCATWGGYWRYGSLGSEAGTAGQHRDGRSRVRRSLLRRQPGRRVGDAQGPLPQSLDESLPGQHRRTSDAGECCHVSGVRGVSREPGRRTITGRLLAVRPPQPQFGRPMAEVPRGRLQVMPAVPVPRRFRSDEGTAASSSVGTAAATHAANRPSPIGNSSQVLRLRQLFQLRKASSLPITPQSSLLSVSPSGRSPDSPSTSLQRSHPRSPLLQQLPSIIPSTSLPVPALPSDAGAAPSPSQAISTSVSLPAVAASLPPRRTTRLRTTPIATRASIHGGDASPSPFSTLQPRAPLQATEVWHQLALSNVATVRLNDLTAMHLQHNPNDPAHVAILAAAFMAFYAMCRPGEVTVRVVSRPHNDRPRWTHLVEYPPTAPDGPSSFGLKLPSDKTHGKTGFDRIAAKQRRMPSLCPVAAVRRHLVTNALAPGERGEECGAFSFRARNGGRRELGESLFVRTINAWLIAANRERITGHCFRIGGATLFFGAGKDLADIRLRGGWESDTYLVYLRDNFVRHAAMFGDVDPTALFYG